MTRVVRIQTVGCLCLLAVVAGCGSDGASPFAPENTAAACQNFEDDDQDGSSDCADADCTAFAFCQTGDAGFLCNAATCPTGCCQNNVCQAGNTTAACGTGGGTCNTCFSVQVCQASSCQVVVPSCSPATCPTGCCQNNVCQTGNTTAACGTGGAACSTCGGAQVCQASSCQNVVPTCSHNTAAGTDSCTGTNICDCPTGSLDCVNAGTCTNAFGRQYRFTIESASVPTTNQGASWDIGGGAPDLYVRLGLNGTLVLMSLAGSDSFSNTYTGTTVDLSVNATTNIQAEVWDEDGVSDDQAFVCSLEPIGAATLRAGRFACSGALGSLLVSIEPLF